MKSLELYLVASKEDKSKESFLNILELSIKAGVSMIQLREKKLSSKEFYELGLSVKALCDSFKIPLIINDRLDIALALDASGVHLGQDDLPLKEARRLLGEQKIIGLSVQNLAQLKYIKGANYLGCGAVFKTNTKEDAKLIGLENLALLCEKSSLPVFAIGGINEGNIKELRGIKLAGIAVVSAIMKAESPFEASLRLKKEVQSL
ncbi:thiamine phosphate synthase [Campylobacter sp. MIT 99-7217]|uniref:thiamine phosphate synthase n=1 Tax=Campylobacter sp. MIT 99-7217 TaxID=535091 RepID=UPI00115AC0EB|nr:thiamine phosphate synthase [Campylobacter sp. MIT 99-7217]TQR32443.1 thiamine phosphate synthase [Campylobacter sp. MIT 99-7217]